MAADFAKLKERAAKRWNDLSSGRHWVRVGAGTSGQARGAYLVHQRAQQAVRALDKAGSKASLSLVSANGLMYMEPILDVTQPDGLRIFYGHVEPDEVEDLLRRHVAEGRPLESKAFAYQAPEGVAPAWDLPRLEDLPAWAMQRRVATRNFGDTDPRDILHYIANGGYSALHKALVELTPQDVLDEVKQSGLRGRGGAAFPAGVKWSFLAPAETHPKYVLCNCEEGDPGAFNDKGIIESDPHTLLEGLILNGYATGADKGFVFVRHGHEIPINNMMHAIQQAYEAGILGEDIFDSGFDFDAEVVFTGDSYVAGEETAMMEAIEGKRATPRFKPPFPAAAGLWQKPTNINNVKTLSYVPQIIANGGEWFKSIGTEASAGTAIVCLSGHIERPGMYEVPMGTTIREVLYELGGGSSTGNDIKLLQTGGPLGGVLGSAAFDTPICFDAMKAAGAILGSGGIIVGDLTVSAVDLIRNLVAFNQFESCGKCFPCRLGNTHMVEVLTRICRAEARAGDLELMERIGASMKTGSLCGHGQLGYEPILSALKYFGDEFEGQMEESAQPVGFFGDGSMILPTRTRP